MMRFQTNEKKETLRFFDPSERAGKKKKIKKAGIISFALSGAMVLGLLSATFLPKPESAKAFESLPEIETIKSTLNGSGKSLKILEVVPNIDEAIFGYYVEGQEPKELVNDVLLPATTKYPSYNGNAARSQAASDYFGSLNNKALIGYDTGASPISFTQTYIEYYPCQDIVTGETGRGAVLVPASKIKDSDSDVSDYMFYKVDTVPFYVGTDEDNEAVFYKEEDEESDEKFDLTAYNGKYVFRGSSSSYYGTIGKTTEWIVSGDEREPYFILDTFNRDNERPVSGEALLLDEAKKETVLALDSGWYGISMEVPFEFTQVYTEYYPWEDVPENLVEQGFVHELDTPGETVTASGRYSDEGRGNGAFALTGSSFDVVSSGGEYYQDIVTGETGRGAVLVPASEIKDSDVSDYMFYKVDTVPFYVGTDEDNEAVFYKEEDEESDEKFDLTAYNGKYVFRGSSSSYYGTIGKTTEWIVSGDEREPYFILDTFNRDNERPVSGEALLLDEAKKEMVLASGSGWYGISMEVPFEKTDSSSAYPYKVNFNIVPKGFIYKGEGNGQFNIDVTAVSGLPSNVEYASKTNSSKLTNPVSFENAPVSYEKVSYSIDVTNNNLFLKYVLDCSDEDASLISSRAKSIQIDAVAATALSVESAESDFSKRGQHYSIKDYDLIVFENGYASNGDIPAAAREAVLSVALDNEDDSTDEKAMIIDADSDLAQDYLMKKPYSKAEKDAADELTNRASSFISGASGFSNGYADGNLFFFRPGAEERKYVVTGDITKAYDSACYAAEGSAFYDVIDEIKYENVLRERAGGKTLEESVDLGKVIRYILNFKKQRKQTKKTSVKILEIEPTDHSELRRSKVAYPDGTGKNAVDGNKYNEFEPFVYDWFSKTYSDDTITLSTMSTYEFVGKIDDITEEYDLIYIGSDVTDFNVGKDENSKVGDVNIQQPTGYDETTYTYDLPWAWHWQKCVRDKRPENGLIWTNAERPGGEFTRDVINTGNAEYRWFIWKDAGSISAGTSVPVMYESDQTFWNGTVLYDAKYSTQFNDTDMNGLVYYNIGDYGYSTEGKRAKGLIDGDADTIEVRYSGNDLTEKKLNELKAFADAGYPVIFADNLINITSAGKTVNNKRVDVNSRMYSFIESVAGKANTYASTAASLSDYNSKLMLQLSLSKPMIDFSFNGGYSPSDYKESDDHNAISNRTLSFKFKILNETDPTPLSTTYSLHLYIDRGSDGIFSEDDEVELSSSDLTGGDINFLMGSIPSSNIDHVYTLNRKLPDGIKGMVPWKLLVEKNGGGLHASKKGYAYTPVSVKEGNGSYSGPITINILQINTTNKERTIDDEIGKKDTYSLQWQEESKQGTFGELFKVVEDSGNYDLTITTVTTDEENDYYNKTHDKEYYAAPKNAKYDINGGAYDMLIIGFGDAYGELVDKTATAVTEFIDSGKAVLFSHDNTAPCNSIDFYRSDPSRGHGYYFNTVVRDRVGLDRYGVTNDDQLFSYIKNKESLNSNQIKSIQGVGYDIAYKPSSNISDKGKTDYHAHGFTDLFTEGLSPAQSSTYKYKYAGITDNITGSMANYETDIITMENEGQITKYPFNIEKAVINDSFTNGRNNMKVSMTHLQYYQMNMSSDDLIVWYCLGHRSSRTEDDLYSFVPNDVANQYYIFTRGNITYSGCGHGGAPSHWDDPTADEAKLFINTMIAAYRAGYAAPELRFVSSQEDEGNVGIGAVCVPYETLGNLYEGAQGATEIRESDVTALIGKINFKFNDTNLDAGRTMGLTEFEIVFPDPYVTKIFEPDDKSYKERTFTHDDFRLLIDDEGHLVFKYKNDKNDSGLSGSYTTQETVKFFDPDGNLVENGKFLSGEVYSLDIQDLVEKFKRYASRSNNSSPFNQKDNYKTPDTFPTEFTISAKPFTRFANGIVKEATDAQTLKITSLKMFDIG